MKYRLLLETCERMLEHVVKNPRTSGAWTDLHPANQKFYAELDKRINTAERIYWEGRIEHYRSRT